MVQGQRSLFGALKECVCGFHTEKVFYIIKIQLLWVCVRACECIQYICER